MDDIVVSIKDVSKVYKLYDKPIDRLKESLSITHKSYHQDHFALEGISLDVHKGECVGIIGTNGSGKSTLLKIITGVLSPTTGSVTVNGKISALLELGAGFNMEYTGIENIYLNGTMLGFSREEMTAKLDDIINFAEIGDFINQPCKTYSSGMFARLAFAVAINVEPDILIVDEALSVGDIFFQSKCYRKFNEFKEAGKTIIFVTHDMGSVIKYCERSMLIHHGHHVLTGTSAEAVDVYKKILANQYDDSAKDEEQEETTEVETQETETKEKQEAKGWKSKLTLNSNLDSYGSLDAEIVDFAIVNDKGEISSSVDKNKQFRIKMKIQFKKDVDHPIFAYTIKDRKGTEITGTNTMLENYTPAHCKSGEIVTVNFDQIMTLQPGQYFLSFGCTGYNGDDLEIYHRLYNACHLEVFSKKEGTLGFFDLNSTVSYDGAIQTK